MLNSLNFISGFFKPGGAFDISGEYCCKCGSRDKLMKLKNKSLCYQHYPVYSKKEIKDSE